MKHFQQYWHWYAIGIVAIIFLAMNWKKWFGKKNGTNGNGVNERRALANKFRTNISGNPSAKNGCQRGHSECCAHPTWAGCSDN